MLTATRPPAPVRGAPASAFDPALAGVPARIVRSDGIEVELDVRRWQDAAAGADRWLLDRCTGPAIDLGCGPGRLIAALVERGVPTLGIDDSGVAQRQCRRRRLPMVRRDVFAGLPAEGCWDHVLLADGNIGIGGDPLRLLRRAARLLHPGGTVLVETDRRADLLWCGSVRVHTVDGASRPLPWACVGADALRALADAAGLVRTDGYAGTRSFVELTS